MADSRTEGEWSSPGGQTDRSENGESTQSFRRIWDQAPILMGWGGFWRENPSMCSGGLVGAVLTGPRGAVGRDRGTGRSGSCSCGIPVSGSETLKL